MSERLSTDEEAACEQRRLRRQARLRISAVSALFVCVLAAAALHAALRPLPALRTPPTASLVP